MHQLGRIIPLLGWVDRFGSEPITWADLQAKSARLEINLANSVDLDSDSDSTKFENIGLEALQFHMASFSFTQSSI